MIETYSYFINKIERKQIIPQKVIIKKLNKENIDELLKLQEEIILQIENDTFYILVEKEYLEKILEEKTGYIYGYYHNDILIAYAVYLVQEENDNDNFCKTIFVKGKVLKIIAVGVKMEYRGNKIQSNTISIANIVASKHKIKTIYSFVHPENKYCLKTMLYNGLKIKKEIVLENKYRRYVLLKEI